MAKRRGNPNWMRPGYFAQEVPRSTEFEMLANELKLVPAQYIGSTELREWAQRNKDDRYVPESLLKAWGYQVDGEEAPKHHVRRISLAA